MRDIEDLVINRAIVCILDKIQNEPIIPAIEMTLSEQNYEYFAKHLLRCFADEDARPASFQSNPNMLKDMLDEMFENEDIFVLNTGKIAKLMLKAILNEEKEPSGDLAVIEFECKKGKFIALMKLNFSDGFYHCISDIDGKVSIGIEKNAVVLPGSGQKIQRVMIYGKNEEIFVYDKDLDSWFLRGFGRMIPGRDDRTNLKAVRKAVEVFARKAYEEDPVEAESFRRKVGDRLRNEDIFDVQSVAATCIEGLDKKEVFAQTIQSVGIEENRIRIDRDWAGKKMQRKRLKMDKDIDLYIDVEAYNDKGRFKITKNGDGTVDIVLKNIRSFTEK